jgi:hypothetical protein
MIDEEIANIGLQGFPHISSFPKTSIYIYIDKNVPQKQCAFREQAHVSSKSAPRLVFQGIGTT